MAVFGSVVTDTDGDSGFVDDGGLSVGLIRSAIPRPRDDDALTFAGATAGAGAGAAGAEALLDGGGGNNWLRLVGWLSNGATGNAGACCKVRSDGCCCCCCCC